MDQELNIVVNAIDESSEALGAVAESLDTVGAAATELGGSMTAAAAEVDGSVDDMESSLTTLNEMMTMDSDDISEKALAVGLSFDDAAGVVSTAANEMKLAMDAVAAAAIEDMADTEVATEEMASTTSTSLLSIGIAAGIAFQGITDEIIDATESSQKWNQMLSALNTELTNEGSSVPASAMANYAQALSQKILFSQQDILSAEETISANKSLGESYQSVTTMAANLATVTGISLPQAADILLKAATDPATAVRQLVADHAQLNPVLVTTIERMAQAGDTADATKMIFDALNGTMGGAATAAAQQQGAQIELLDQKMQALQKSIGDAVIPVLDQLAKDILPIVTSVEDWIDKHQKLTAEILLGAAALAGLLASLGILGFLLPAIEIGFGLVTDPLALLVVGVIALIGYFGKDLPQAWDTAKTYLQNLWDIIQQSGVLTIFENGWKVIVSLFENELLPALENLWNTFKPYVPTLEALAGVVATMLVVGFEGLVMILEVALTWFADILTSGIKFTSWITTEAYNAFQSFSTGFTTYVIDPIETAINFIETLINDMKAIGGGIGGGISSAVGGIGNFVSTHLATGGIVNSPTVALIGEAGPEAVIPLSMLGSSDGGGIGGGNNGGINITLTGNTLYTTSQQAKQLGDAMARQINAQLKLRSW